MNTDAAKNDEVRIFRARPGDLEEIKKMYVTPGGGDAYLLHFLPEWIRLKNFTTYVASIKEEIVGTASLFLMEDFAWLTGLRVRPLKRMMGVATKLNQTRLSSVPRNIPVNGTIFETNTAAVNLYEKLGFEIKRGLAVASLTPTRSITNKQTNSAHTIDHGVPGKEIEIFNFLTSNYNLASIRFNSYGEDFIWHPLTSPKKISDLLFSQRILVERGWVGNICAIGIIHWSNFPSYDNTGVLEIGRIWGRAENIINYVLAEYRPTRVRWYIFAPHEEEVSSEFNFQIPVVKINYLEGSQLQRFIHINLKKRAEVTPPKKTPLKALN